MEVSRDATSGQLNCWLCQVKPKHGVGEHVVAITLLPDMGNNAAAIAANILLQHCSQLRYLIMCGIAGAVPNLSKAEEHVRLGDIVVSDNVGIIQYERGKQRDPRTSSGLASDPLAGLEFRGPPRPPCPNLLSAVRRIHAEEERIGPKHFRDWEKKINEFLDRCHDPQKWKRPYYTKDILQDGIDKSEERSTHPRDNARRSIGRVKCPRVFRGPIGAANIVLADPARREALRTKHKIKAVEMEGSGIADASWVAGCGYLVVRGTCDYCNSSKNDDWHSYAALIAAAYACTVVEYLHFSTTPGPTSSDQAIAFPPEMTDRRAIEMSSDKQTSTINSHDNMTGGAAITSSRSLAPVSSSGIGLDNSELQHAHIAKSIKMDVSPTTIMIVEQLSEQITNFMNESRWAEARKYAVTLESLLTGTARRGHAVRQGWVVLAKVEQQRIRNSDRRQAIDVTRLQYLRKAAESVID